MVNIQTVIANLLNTIRGKEQLLAEYERSLCLAQMSDTATVEFLKLNIKELNAILTDCQAVQEPVAEGYMKCPACNDRGVIRQHFTELERMLIEDAFEKAVKKAAPVQQAEQEPVAFVNLEWWMSGSRAEECFDHHPHDTLTPLYAAPVRTKDLTEQQALEKLCNYINQNFKTQKEAAKSFEVTEGFLSMVLNGKKPITEAMAHRLSLTRQTMFLELTSLANGNASPVRTKDLTEAEIDEIWKKHSGGNLGFAYAVIAAYKEKNK